eukprot:TRINITY_DN19134_c0_g1_i2.p1 TRINITY_DN19134_c0_g1~~TRINITY_DN19134_c0_g1_i2.p1  ORF type:complete len:260 (+),score=65.20 TRINITY_DN19134_c0_g1_i2:262-1041(+)
MSAAALARLQRASADIKRGKRRRRPTEAPAAPGAAVADAAGDASGAAAQSVPNKTSLPASKPPVVKVKEERRKKRLLRNRVSAQQARERKRQHVTELEEQCTKWEQQNVELEEKAVRLTKENEELRQVVKLNMRANTGNVASSDARVPDSSPLSSFPSFPSPNPFPSATANLDPDYQAPLFHAERFVTPGLKPPPSYHHPLSLAAQESAGAGNGGGMGPGMGMGLDTAWDSGLPQSNYADLGGGMIGPVAPTQFMSMFE